MIFQQKIKLFNNNFGRTLSARPWNLQYYFTNLENFICDTFSEPTKKSITFDLLQTETNIQHKEIALKLKQNTMKIGIIWQEAIGSYRAYQVLEKGNPFGLDIISHEKKVVIELKNSIKTDNSSSRKTNFDKLAKFKKSNPDYRCIYATINSVNEAKTMEGKIKKLIHQGVELEWHVGYPFLQFIFNDDTSKILNFLKETIKKHSS